MAERLRKTCEDCGKRGNWPRKIVVNTCPDCTSVRLQHDAVRGDAFKACIKKASAGGPACYQMTDIEPCSSCAAYIASKSHAFWRTH